MALTAEQIQLKRQLLEQKRDLLLQQKEAVGKKEEPSLGQRALSFGKAAFEAVPQQINPLAQAIGLTRAVTGGKEAIR